LQVAEALVVSGQYNNILIAAGEIPSRAAKLSVTSREDFRKSFVGYALGDAGAAAVVGLASDPTIQHLLFKTVGSYWDAAAVLAGGTMFGYSEEHAYFQGDGNRLQTAFKQDGPTLLDEALAATNTNIDDYKLVLIHQVSLSVLETTAATIGIPPDRIEVTLPKYGNMVSASLPVAYDVAMERGDLKVGDLVMWIGLAAGVSMSVMLTRV
jgi:acyl-CoA:acyl-CoA alkyltransferase